MNNNTCFNFSRQTFRSSMTDMEDLTSQHMPLPCIPYRHGSYSHKLLIHWLEGSHFKPSSLGFFKKDKRHLGVIQDKQNKSLEKLWSLFLLAVDLSASSLRIPSAGAFPGLLFSASQCSVKRTGWEGMESLLSEDNMWGHVSEYRPSRVAVSHLLRTHTMALWVELWHRAIRWRMLGKHILLYGEWPWVPISAEAASLLMETVSILHNLAT